MRKIYGELLIKIVVACDNGIEITDVLSDMDYNFISQTDGADIQDTEILDFNITDVK